MFELFKRYQTLVLLGAIVLLPLVIYRAQSGGVRRANPLEKLLLTVTSPVERSIAWGVDKFSETYDRYFDVRHAREENISLRQGLFEQRIEVEEARALISENARLRELLELRAKNASIELLPASVVGASHSPFHRSVRIDRGQVDGVVRGAAVMSEVGLVGRVQRVGFKAAEVLLISDEQVSLDVVLPRSRVRGRLSGTGAAGDFELRILELLRTDDVQKGDLVVTSGLAGAYPRGIPVGVIESARALVGAQEPEVVVRPHAALGRLGAVLIAKKVEGEDAELIFTPPELLPPELQAGHPALERPPISPDAGVDGDAGSGADASASAPEPLMGPPAPKPAPKPKPKPKPAPKPRPDAGVKPKPKPKPGGKTDAGARPSDAGADPVIEPPEDPEATPVLEPTGTSTGPQ